MNNFFEIACNILSSIYPTLSPAKLRSLLDSWSQKKEVPVTGLISGRDVAKRLGVSLMTVQRLAAQGTIQKIRIQTRNTSWVMKRGKKSWIMPAGRVRYLETDVEKIIRNGMKK